MSNYHGDPELAGIIGDLQKRLKAAETAVRKFHPPVNVLDFGADPTGTDDSLAAILRALADNNAATVPAGTYRLDAVLEILEYRVLVCEAGVTLIRQSAHSSDTDAVVRLRGTVEGGRIEAPWGGVTLKTENASPRGVLNPGPHNKAVSEDVGRCTASGLIIRGRGTGTITDIGLCFDSSQAAVVNGGANSGSSYNHLVTDCRIHDVGTGVQWAELANANRVRDIRMSNIGYVAYHVKGGSDTAHATAEVGAAGGFVDRSTDRAITIIKCERALFPQFEGILAEPDAPGGNTSVPYNIDANSSDVFIDGYFNMTGTGVNSGTSSFIRDQATLQVPTLVWGNPSARVFNSANLSIPNSSGGTVLTFDSVRFNHWAMWDVLTNDRLIAQRAGVYKMTARVGFATSALGTFRQLSLRVNGGTVLDVDRRLPITGLATPAQVTCEHELALGDFVQILASQDSGGALNVNATSQWSPEFSMVYMGASQ